ncbi:MAG TPA: type I DNA topoisomerase [Syntrophales bacterium]|nr:type I DNA topoisomerase [Syntrophales bacterium]
MSNSLIIVESPTKVKTIKKYLGADFNVRASVGHVKDLPKSKLGIDVENDFSPTYEVMESKKKVVAELKKAARQADNIYLAPDPDREGEAIAWHIAEEIGAKNKIIRRVLFNDLTKPTILKALNHPLELDFDKYEAQQTRRILDRLVGYQLSPLLWEKVKRGLSAGRVQSVAVRIICDREEEIRCFIPEEYWNITATLEGKNPPPFEARLIKINGKKAKIGDGVLANQILETVKVTPFVIAEVERKEVKKSPPPPFTTSKLQQEASRWLRFSAKKTMSTAQKLYEGVELGKEGQVGLITYMRTDSLRISNEAMEEVRNYIKANYDDVYLPPKARFFKNAQGAQDAHEAVRPTSMAYRPLEIKHHLTPDQFRLYQLIWNRFVACQMNPAVFDQTTIDVACGAYLFRAQGAIMKFPGFTAIYTEGKEENGNGEDREVVKILPEVSKGESTTLISLNSDQKFTQPPPRFSEASLVRELEEKGIGRPSTYAAILSTIQDREYARLEKGKFFPTELGILVTELLVKNFPRILDTAFTASMETKLDMIEQGQSKRLDTLKDFYLPFTEELKKAKKDMRNVKREEKPTDIVCEKCQYPMVIKWGRNGSFMACSNYPACKNTRNVTSSNGEDAGKVEDMTEEIKCEKCGQKMVAKEGRFGKFLACSGYPECKNTMKVNGGAKSLPAVPTDVLCGKCNRNMVIKEGRFGKFLACSGYPECKNTMPFSMGIKCPSEGCSGDICEKRTKTGRVFYGCSRYPDCKFSTWTKPVKE